MFEYCKTVVAIGKNTTSGHVPPDEAGEGRDEIRGPMYCLKLSDSNVGVGRPFGDGIRRDGDGRWSSQRNRVLRISRALRLGIIFIRVRFRRRPRLGGQRVVEPVKVRLAQGKCFLPLQPDGHLGGVVPTVRSLVSLLGKVDVKPLRELHVITISAAESPDTVDIMLKGMELRYIKMFAYLEVDKNILVRVKCVERLLQPAQGLWCVRLKLGVVNEVHQRLDNGENPCIDRTRQHTEEDSLHLFVLCPCPLGDGRDSLLELPEPWMRIHGFETRVKFSLAQELATPFDKMIFEDALVELMEEIRREAGEDITVGKVSPERLVDFA